MGKLHVRQLRSLIGQSHSVKSTVLGLGLGGPGTVAVVENTPSFRGAIKKVIHLVSLSEDNSGGA